MLILEIVTVGSLDWRDISSTSLTTTVLSHDNKTKQIITQVPGAYLRSQRLEHKTGQHNIDARLIEKLEMMLTELQVPNRPLPTSKVCDAYDTLRQVFMKAKLVSNLNF